VLVRNGICVMACVLYYGCRVFVLIRSVSCVMGCV